MNQTTEQIRATMCDAGCSEAEIAEALLAYRAGDPVNLLRQLRISRCLRLEELHESQRRVDRLDYLIRQTQKRTKSSV